MDSTDSEEYESSSSGEGWVEMYVKKFSAPVLVIVDHFFIEDMFNLYGLAEQVKDFAESLEVIRSRSYATSFSKREETLYFLIHQRYILTKSGMDAFRALLCSGVYGKCKRVQCKGFPLLPAGLSDFPHCSNTKLFCDLCTNLYEPTGDLSTVDGCAFGRTFPHLFILIHKDLFQKRKDSEKYTPRIFGFEIERNGE